MATDDDTTDPVVSELAREVAGELEPGTVIDSKVILSRQQVAAVLAGSATLAGVLGLTAGSASAQTGGTLGAPNAEIDAELGNFGSTSTADGFELTIEGDTYQFNA
jgi:hypothetical protein